MIDHEAVIVKGAELLYHLVGLQTNVNMICTINFVQLTVHPPVQVPVHTPVQIPVQPPACTVVQITVQDGV